MTTKRESIQAPEGSIAALRQLAALLAEEKGVDVNMRVAVGVAIEEAISSRSTTETKGKPRPRK